MQISIVGCGWLGLPLAKHLKDCGHKIVATKRSEEDAEQLSSLGFTGLSYELGDNLSKPYYSPLFKSDLLVLNIPPGRKNFVPEKYTSAMMDLVQQAKERGIKHVIFISTTAVYGEKSRTVYEYSETEPATLSAKAHLKIEQFCQTSFADNTCILRLSGLIGQVRHPIKTLSGRKDLANGQRSVNLIHQEDVIAAITNIIDKKTYGHTLHLSATEHPSRKEYYQWAARQLALEEPEFIPLHDALDSGKLINADLSIEKLGLTLKYPSPYDMIASKQ